MRTELVIDRLAYWYYHPREWLKKAALINGTYLLNSPFTFQSMEKHSAYCAMLRLGLKIPDTVLVPYKNPVDNVRWAYTSEKYNQSFDLDAIADELGYPMYMKPFDGGGWRGVSRINDRDDLHRAYDESGEMLMHLQATVDYEHFARALSIGPETMVMDFRPDQPMHNRYAVSHDFLSAVRRPPGGGDQPDRQRVLPLGVQLREMLVAGDEVYPIDYANACPDVAVTSLHYYFPWAITALVRWSVYCLVTGRSGDGRPRDRAVLRRSPTTDRSTTTTSSTRYLALADEHFETERYCEWCDEHLPHLPTSRCTSGSTLRRVRPAAARHRARRPTRRTSRSSSWPTSAACSGCGRRPERVGSGVGQPDGPLAELPQRPLRLLVAGEPAAPDDRGQPAHLAGPPGPQ